MKNFKNLISERLKADTAANSVTSEESADVQADFDNVDNKKISSDVTKVKESENENIVAAIVEKPTADDVPIYTATSAEKIEENSAAQNNSDSTASDDSCNFVRMALDDYFPIYIAEEGQIDYWHACVNIHILDFLRTYDLDRQSLAFDSFRIGVDDEKHAITFSLDDTHYLKIDLNDTNVRPIDKEQAEKVLRKVNAMRFEKVKDHPFYRPRTW